MPYNGERRTLVPEGIRLPLPVVLPVPRVQVIALVVHAANGARGTNVKVRLLLQEIARLLPARRTLPGLTVDATAQARDPRVRVVCAVIAANLPFLILILPQITGGALRRPNAA